MCRRPPQRRKTRRCQVPNSKISFTFFLFCLLILILINLISPFDSFSQSEETITVTTYYPAPYGVYNETRAKRMAIGDSYYDGSQFCWSADPSCVLDNIAANADLVVEGNVGIGTPSPAAVLHVFAPSAAPAEGLRISGQGANAATAIGFFNGTTARWRIGTSGASDVNNFQFYRFDNSGNFIDVPLTILRSNGNARSSNLTVGTDPDQTLTTKSYVDAAAGGPGGWTCINRQVSSAPTANS